MTDTILILVGTMSGNAEMAADAIAEQVEDAGFRARILRMEKATPALLVANPTWIICSSTYGTGEVPDNAKAFYAALGQERPDLSGGRYGVFGLGDSVYPNTFNFGPRLFDTLLGDLGAARIGERFEHDARGRVHADDAAEAWAGQWLQALALALAAA